MKRTEIEALRARVSCEALLEWAGYRIDLKESTRRAVKYRKGGDIIIVTHAGRGWFDPLSDDKGDVFGLAMLIDKLPFPSAVKVVASLVGFQLSRPDWKSHQPSSPIENIAERWRARLIPSPGSATWGYLNYVRRIPNAIIHQAIRDGVLREGPFGSMWAAHVDSAGRIVGWEERGPDWRGFSTGGSKILFRLGPSDASRLCVTEASIDAMSLAAFEGVREQTVYLSTGGGWSPATDAALGALAARPGLTLVAATDANPQGEIYAERLRMIADQAGSDWHRLRPPGDDWNDVLQNRGKEDSRGKKGRARHAACAPAGSREASPGQSRPLSRADREAGNGKGS